MNSESAAMPLLTRFTHVLRHNLTPLTSDSEELLNIDLLRFIASAGIVLCHSAEFFWPPHLRHQPAVMTAGLPLFVDVFFVISGFIITYFYRDRINTGRKYGLFLQRRIGRLYPLHILTLLIYLLVALILQFANIKMSHPSSTSPGCLAVTALLIHAVIPCSGLPLNGVTWSLSAEMLMYFLFPVLIWLTGRSAWRSAAVTVLSFILVIVVSGVDTAWQNHFGVFRALPAFMVGMTACFSRDALRRIPMPHAGVASGLTLLVIGSVIHAHNVIMVALAYAIPVFAIAADAQGRITPFIRRFAPLGQLTYPIYMIHGLFIMLIMNAMGDKLLHLSTGPMIILGLTTYALLGLTSWASFRLFEQPARKWIDKIPLFTARTIQ